MDTSSVYMQWVDFFLSECKSYPGEAKSTFQTTMQIDISPGMEKLCINEKVIVFLRLQDRKSKIFHP